MPLNFTNVNDNLTSVVHTVEDAMLADLNNFDPETASSADLISMQVGLQKWTLATNLQTNALKTLGDGLKNTVSNVR